MREKARGYRVLAVMSVIATMLASCAPAYDDIADKMVSDMQKQTDDGLVKLESLATTIDGLHGSTDPASKSALDAAKTKASYVSNLDFYGSLEASAVALEARMTAMPDLSTPKLEDALTKLQTNIGELHKEHARRNILDAAYAKSARQLLDQQFKALTVYEVTLKSGATPK